MYNSCLMVINRQPFDLYYQSMKSSKSTIKCKTNLFNSNKEENHILHKDSNCRVPIGLTGKELEIFS